VFVSVLSVRGVRAAVLSVLSVHSLPCFLCADVVFALMLSVRCCACAMLCFKFLCFLCAGLYAAVFSVIFVSSYPVQYRNMKNVQLCVQYPKY
jgi:hypothetical protein